VPTQHKVDAVLRYITDNLAGDVRLDDAGDRNLSNLNRQFRAETEMTSREDRHKIRTGAAPSLAVT
jgi:methylphosphotriester-DNA--protein-cysteine methyltransferase